MGSSSTITALSGSDWLNAVVQSNVMGEIIATFPQQILYTVDSSKVLRKRRMVGLIFSIQFHETFSIIAVRIRSANRKRENSRRAFENYEREEGDITKNQI